MKNTPYIFFAGLLLGGCSFQDPSRVESDFGVSVRSMVSAQIYDPEAAAEPAVLGPATLGGVAATAAVDGYQNASRDARVERQRSTRSPLPIVGITSGSE